MQVVRERPAKVRKGNGPQQIGQRHLRLSGIRYFRMYSSYTCNTFLHAQSL